MIGDKKRLRQILVILVGNALKFSTQGQIRVDINVLSICNHSQPRLVICVQDSGPGIPDDKLQDIFDPFTQADGSYIRKYQGAGLGLSIVTRLLELMQGSLCIDSCPHEGTTVCASIPIQIPKNTARLSVSDRPRPCNDCLGILLVEDDAINAQISAKILEMLGHRVSIAYDGQQAVEQALTTRFDLIFMDIQMPVMDGVQATKIIRTASGMASSSDIPIVAMTAHALRGEREHFLQAGMNDYLSKPAHIDDIQKIIKSFFP